MLKYLIAFVMLLIVSSWILYFLRALKSRQDLSKDRGKISQILKNFESLRITFNDDSQYFRSSKFKKLTQELMDLRNELTKISNRFLKEDIEVHLRQITDFQENLSKQRNQINGSFFQKEKERCKDLFYDKAGKPLLTEEQIRAVLSDDDRNLIVAGAGSGKTRVIDYKVRYLVNYKNVSPCKIVLLSFSRKSATDLVEKISKSVSGIEARTIHAFSSQVSKTNGRKIFNDSANEMGLFVIRALVETLKERKFAQIFIEFYEKFFSDIKPFIFYENLNDLREDLRKNNASLLYDNQFHEIRARRFLKTLKGEYVRSVDERYIADFLFLHGIRYEYEKDYPHCEVKYQPDFYLPDYDIYLEHFAITANGGPPVYFTHPDKYLNGIKWKRELHKENKTRMIESTSYLLHQKKSSEYLRDLLILNGINISDYGDDEKIFGMISQQFSRFFLKFYNSLKLSGLSLLDLKNSYSDLRYSLFLNFFERFLFHFENQVKEQHKMDFSDLILEAIEWYKNNPERSFDYIILDEFQDTSNLALRLLNQVYEADEKSIFLGVGDDWQSIYGFNGSDVTIMSDYPSRYEGVAIQKLNSNFRSHAKIVDLGKRFISKNPSQISKNVYSENNRFSDSNVNFMSFEQMEEVIDSIPNDESIFVLYRYNDDCPAGRGLFREYFDLTKDRKPRKKLSCKKDISLMTIHASKGLEARHVFILFPDGFNRKFPSEMEDHFLFDMLKSKSDNYPFSEERRLMYVAITRAEQNLYFVNPSGKDPNSVFWDELQDLVN